MPAERIKQCPVIMGSLATLDKNNVPEGIRREIGIEKDICMS